MRLRSGRQTNKCGLCREYYGNPEWNNKCSNCSGMGGIITPIVFDKPEFQNDLNDWVKSNLIEKPMEIVLVHVCRNLDPTDNTDFALLRQVLQIVKMEKKYISAELAETLCRNTGRDTWNKSQLILQFVADWWNMRKYKFTNTEMCYFGRFGDMCDIREEIKSIPPPPPHRPPLSEYII